MAPMTEDSVSDDDPLVPEGEDWEDRVGDLLRGDDVDTDLGRRMARDAIRVARGELSDEEFNERYRDEVERVFATTDWPTDAEEDDHGTDTSEDSSDNSPQNK